ncbi:CPBP family intramembrane glutamic endopeptidase [Krasilnikovia sp. MM14-A1259]|uniref:CPBP family intramembrane glutamic endopeptidase n=1 Tax=Krasilnikovia sp. MM14-A1259 TaxID=3373539 RepID=UPI0038185C76
MPTRRLSAVLIVFLAVSALASPLLALAQQRSGVPESLVRLPVFATAVGAAVVWSIWRPYVLRPPVIRTGIARTCLVAFAMAGAVAVVLLIVTRAEGSRWPLLSPSTLPAPLLVVLVVQLLGAAGEEIGWRGVVQPALERRLPVVRAGLVTGVLFGIGHFYVLASGVWTYLVFLMSAVGMSVALAALTAGHGLLVRISAATLMHWLVNVVILTLFADGDESLLWTVNTAVAMLSLGAVAAKRMTGNTAADRQGQTTADPTDRHPVTR